MPASVSRHGFRRARSGHVLEMRRPKHESKVGTRSARGLAARGRDTHAMAGVGREPQEDPTSNLIVRGSSCNPGVVNQAALAILTALSSPFGT